MYGIAFGGLENSQARHRTPSFRCSRLLFVQIEYSKIVLNLPSGVGFAVESRSDFSFSKAHTGPSQGKQDFEEVGWGARPDVHTVHASSHAREERWLGKMDNPF